MQILRSTGGLLYALVKHLLCHAFILLLTASTHQQRRNINTTMSKPEPSDQGSFRHIPEEILIQILQRVPTKSLVKVITVSKYWHYLVNNFINSTRTKVLVMANDSICSGPVLLSSIDNQSCVEKVNLNIPYTYTTYPEIKFYGSCNGFVLLKIGHDFYMWNPLTKYTENLLLRSRVEMVLKSKLGSPIVSILVLGLCHDTNADKYKVVIAARDKHRRYVHAYVFVVCHGATYHTQVDFGYHFRSFRLGPVLKGYLHSLSEGVTHEGSDSHDFIIAFNPKTDSFSEVLMPEPKDGSGDLVAGLGLLGGCLCVTRWESPQIKTSNIEILVMKEYGVGSSWTIMCSIRNFDSFGYIHTMVPFCYTRDGEAIMHVNGKHIRALNFNKNALKEVEGVFGTYKYNAVLYKENWYPPY